jgi:hypothetical protein
MVFEIEFCKIDPWTTELWVRLPQLMRLDSADFWNLPIGVVPFLAWTVNPGSWMDEVKTSAASGVDVMITIYCDF